MLSRGEKPKGSQMEWRILESFWKTVAGTTDAKAVNVLGWAICSLNSKKSECLLRAVLSPG